MKVVSQVMTESRWQDDKDISGCQICKSAFSVAKRKVSVGVKRGQRETAMMVELGCYIY